MRHNSLKYKTIFIKHLKKKNEEGVKKLKGEEKPFFHFQIRIHMSPLMSSFLSTTNLVFVFLDVELFDNEERWFLF